MQRSQPLVGESPLFNTSLLDFGVFCSAFPPSSALSLSPSLDFLFVGILVASPSLEPIHDSTRPVVQILAGSRALGSRSRAISIVRLGLRVQAS